MSDDTRQSRRRRVLKGAIATFNGRHSTIPVTVRDLSEVGGRLIVTGSIGLPDTFELLIELDGTMLPCQVVWRHGSEVGITFSGPPQPFAPTRTQILKAHTPVGRQRPPSLRALKLKT